VKARILVCKAANFPNDSTAEQLYGDREFEAYRMLGYLAAEHPCGNRFGRVADLGA
jgi:hypothetical protein